MSTKDITDLQVVQAVNEYQKVLAHEIAIREVNGPGEFIDDILMRVTGQCRKVCNAAMARAMRRGYSECGVTERTAWLTATGKELLATAPPLREPKATVSRVVDPLRDIDETIGWIDVPLDFVAPHGNAHTLVDLNHWHWTGHHWRATTMPPRMDRIQFFATQPVPADLAAFVESPAGESFPQLVSAQA